MPPFSGRARVSGAVLCIDDSHVALQLRKALLENAGYAVITTISTVRGIELACLAVKLVMVDYEMPVENGIQVARHIRALRPTVPILMVSGAFTGESCPSEIDGFVSKAQSPEVRLQAVNTYLSSKSLRIPAVSVRSKDDLKNESFVA